MSEISQGKQQIINLLSTEKITIWGLGAEGISTLDFLKNEIFPDTTNEHTRSVAIYDKDKSVCENVIKKYPFVKMIIKDVEQLLQYDLIIKSPGVCIHDISSTIKDEIIKKLTSQTDIFLSVFKKSCIGITGTKGKSTTSSLTYALLSTYSQHTIFAGNIGEPLFNVIDDITPKTKIVLELSSHQLEFVRHSPHISVITNLLVDHMDYYESVNQYHSAKLNITKFQTKKDILIYPQNFSQNNDFNIDKYKTKARRVICENGHYLRTRLIGEHNQTNIYIALIVLDILTGIDSKAFSIISEYKPLKHRLEFVKKINGVNYFDDSISTISNTTICGIKAINDDKNLNAKVSVVIIGGYERNIDYTPLKDYLTTHDIIAILLPDTGWRIFHELSKDIDTTKRLVKVDDLEQAVKVASELAPEKTSVLFSPAAASFNCYKDFNERGDAFQTCVKNISLT